MVMMYCYIFNIIYVYIMILKKKYIYIKFFKKCQTKKRFVIKYNYNYIKYTYKKIY